MRIVHTADVHIKDSATLDAMRAEEDCASQNGARTILVAGDLFDKDYSHRTLEGELVGILESFDGEILVLPGNHDAEFLKTRKSLSRNSRVLDSDTGVVRETLGGVELIALPFRDDVTLKDYGGLGADPANSILTVHGSFYTTEFFYDSSDRKSYFPVFEEDVRDKFRYVALGHYHRVIRKRFGKTEVVNPGSPRVTRAGDYGERVVSLLDTDGWKVELAPLAVAYDELVELVVSAFDTPDSAMKRLSKLLEGVNARVVVMIAGMLPPAAGSPSDWAELARAEIAKAGLEGSADVSGAVQLKAEVLANPFVQRLLTEAETIADDRGEDAEKAKLIALERIASIIK
jgi:DNA repair exonuclease SbcCD nuclease subunit